MEGERDARACLKRGGAVAARLPGFRTRAEQLEMTAAVEEALAGGRHLVVEAGTGVGKTFAYLVPLLLHVARGGGPAVVATRTIALQEQLVGKDIPLLAGALGLEGLPVALAKGRGNYVCLRRMELAWKEGRGLLATEEELAQLGRVREWAFSSRDGTLSDLGFRPSADVWEAVRAEQGNCLHKRCRFYEPCPYQRSRREMHAARVIVANHALVLADLALRQAGKSFLPDYETLVVDEAHELEESAAESFGVSVSRVAFSRQIARVFSLLPRVGGGDALRGVAGEVAEGAKGLFESAARLRGEAAERRLTAPGEFADPLSEPLGRLVASMRARLASISDMELAFEWKARAGRLEELGEAVRLVHQLADSSHVC
ncbi:MAG: ATP-dependent DNA helicase, partial [Planctomycetota bacterium]